MTHTKFLTATVVLSLVALAAHVTTRQPVQAAARQADWKFATFGQSKSSMRLTISRQDATVTNLSVAIGTYFAFYSQTEATTGPSRWAFSGPTEIRLRASADGLSIKGTSPHDFMAPAEVVITVRGADVVWDSAATSN